MDISATINGVKYKARVPERGSPCVEVDAACPKCKHAAPILIQGFDAMKQINNDTVEAPARAMCCKKEIGTIRVKMDTLFGIEEDDAVVEQVRRSGGKVYG